MAFVVKNAFASFLLLSIRSVEAYYCPTIMKDAIWANTNNIMSLVVEPATARSDYPISDAIVSFTTEFSGCSTVAEELVAAMEDIAKTTIEANDVERLQVSLEELIELVPPYVYGLEDHHYYDFIDVVTNKIEVDALEVGFASLDLYLAAISIRLASRHALLSKAIRCNGGGNGGNYPYPCGNSNNNNNGGDQNHNNNNNNGDSHEVSNFAFNLANDASASLRYLQEMEDDFKNHLDDFEVICTKRVYSANDGGGGYFRTCTVKDPRGNTIETDDKVDRGSFQVWPLFADTDPTYAANPNGGGQTLLQKVKRKITSEVFDAKYYQMKLDMQRVVSANIQYDGFDYHISVPPSKVSWAGTSAFECNNVYWDPRKTLYGDFNGNGIIDVIFQPTSNELNVAWYIAYDGADKYVDDNVQTVPHLWGLDRENMVLGDFNGDGNIDIFTTIDDDGKWYVSYSGVDDWTVLKEDSIQVDNLRFGDFNGDGKTDVFTTWGDGKWHVSYSGTETWSDLGESSIEIDNLRFGDFNGDGKTDIFTLWNGVWRISYGGTTSWTITQNSDQSLDELRFGDMDGYGTTDVFASSGGDWKVSNSGTSAWVTINQSGYTTDELLFEDLDGDGRIDIFVKPEAEDGTTC